MRARGFDHTTQGAFALATGISKALGLDREQTVNAIALCGTAFNALRVMRTGKLSHWKGLAYPNTAFCCTHGTFLAMSGVTGPREVFEGNNGFMDTISGKFVIDWSKENLERVTKTIIKKYNAEIHSQSAIEGLLELKREHGFRTDGVDRIEIDIIDIAYNIIGGGEEGDKTKVRTKEGADHSLYYMVAVALLDGQVLPDQYRPERILRHDVQSLLRKVTVRSDEACSRLFPEQHACRLRVTLNDGQVFSGEKRDYEGFHTRPMGWGAVKKKFELLTVEYLDNRLRKAIINAVGDLENITVADLTVLLSRVKTPVP